MVSNTISFEAMNLEFSMSNGLTQVFIEILVLSGSRLAKRESEKRFIIWLAEQDQTKKGLGMVGFDICEMPWSLVTFEMDKNFLLEVILQAKNKLDWEKLEYQPEETTVFVGLDSFLGLLQQIQTGHIKSGDFLKEWLQEAMSDDPVVSGFPKCGKHHVFLSNFGCCICNSETRL